jgi:hypothetical protein
MHLTSFAVILALRTLCGRRLLHRCSIFIFLNRKTPWKLRQSSGGDKFTSQSQSNREIQDQADTFARKTLEIKLKMQSNPWSSPP